MSNAVRLNSSEKSPGHWTPAPHISKSTFAATNELPLQNGTRDGNSANKAYSWAFDYDESGWSDEFSRKSWENDLRIVLLRCVGTGRSIYANGAEDKKDAAFIAAYQFFMAVR
ncbi:hypothetical protein Y032_0003g1385 [Ancylostoma ceylanicum]|uniref:Uncharacterized protein n=1 Tax=Ancylostoma ceylanicum TaxID=53326 RepID=A0A016VZB4_9BILA|nr:hypothetical protein Y032_0003g1385 [Ancylostoma ceylanicum]